MGVCLGQLVPKHIGVQVTAPHSVCSAGEVRELLIPGVHVHSQTEKTGKRVKEWEGECSLAPYSQGSCVPSSCPLTHLDRVAGSGGDMAAVAPYPGAGVPAAWCQDGEG